MATTTNFQPNVTKDSVKTMKLHELARIARKDKPNWNGGIYFGAVPYLDAMASLDNITDRYIMESGKSIVAYFLGNASMWRGETAKIVKAELNRRLK